MIVGDKAFKNHVDWVEDINEYIEQKTVEFHNEGRSIEELDLFLFGAYRLRKGLSEDIRCYLNRGLND